MSQTATQLIYSGQVRRALRFCELAHRGVRRKSGDVPYMAHPVAVAMVLAAAGVPEEVIVAALLHDVVEDTDYTLADIADQFGQRVADLVASVTKAERGPDGRELSKAELNELTIQGLALADIDSVAVKAGDLICNLSDVVLDARGDAAYLRALYGEQKAQAKVEHYLRLAALLSDRLIFAGRYTLLADILTERTAQIRTLAGMDSGNVDAALPQLVPLIYSGQVRAALQLAERSHRGTTRKGTDLPFILHPIVVAALLAAAGADADLLCAAYLEDAVEEGGVTLATVEDHCGHRAATLVAAVTKPEYGPDGGKLTSDEKDRLAEARVGDWDVAETGLKAADLCANIADLVLDCQEHGPEHWQLLFGERTDTKLDHYLRIAELLANRLLSFGAYPVLADALRERAEALSRLRGRLLAA